MYSVGMQTTCTKDLLADKEMDYRITESENQLGWKRPVGSSPTYDPTPPCQPDHGTELSLSHVQS